MPGIDETVKTCKCYLPGDLHERFIKKIAIEGWTIQQALVLLIRSYVDESLESEEDG